MTTINKFLGVWELDSCKNEYQTPNAPKTGLYTISILDGNKLLFDIKWTDSQDKEFSASYSTVVDGVKYAYENPDIADFIETAIIGDNIMQTLTYKNGKVIAKGIRELSEDNNSMIVIQENLLPTGETVVNKSVYNNISK